MGDFDLGKKLELPKGTPHMPHGYERGVRPYPGATRDWAGRTKNQVERIQRKVPGVVCATYAGHGRTGEAWGIDVMVSPVHQRFSHAQKEFGWELCRWLLRNWDSMHLNYLIFDNFMNDINGQGWFDYEPLRRDWIRRSNGGSPNVVTSRHRDHVHIQIDNPHIGGNE